MELCNVADTYEGIRIFLARHSFMDINNVCVCVCCVFSYSQIKMYMPRIFLPTSLSLHSKCKIGC